VVDERDLGGRDEALDIDRLSRRGWTAETSSSFGIASWRCAYARPSAVSSLSVRLSMRVEPIVRLSSQSTPMRLGRVAVCRLTGMWTSPKLMASFHKARNDVAMNAFLDQGS